MNNLTFVRFIASILVLYGHSFVFLGLKEPIFLSWLPLGPLGVYIFFIISGYLVSQSWTSDPNIIRFFIRRSLRIFPALVICVLLSVFVLGPISTNLTLGSYLSDPNTFRYLKNIFLYIHYSLPGVFDGLRVPNAINGSLWSLPIEFSMYILVALLGIFAGNKKLNVLMMGVISGIICFSWALKTNIPFVIFNSDLRYVFICGVYFWAGAIIFKFNLERFFSITLSILCMVLMFALESNQEFLSILSVVLLPIIVISFGLDKNRFINVISNKSDYSYGIYLYAFPVQQTIVFLRPNIEIKEYLVVTFGVTFLIAFLSWHLIEKKALLLKPKNYVKKISRSHNDFKIT